jgi:hypothetical protein
MFGMGEIEGFDYDLTIAYSTVFYLSGQPEY